MNNTHFHDDRNLVVKNRVTAYLPNSNGGFAVALIDVESVGAGGLYSSVEDLFLWDQNFYNNKLGGGPGLIAMVMAPIIFWVLQWMARITAYPYLSERSRFE